MSLRVARVARSLLLPSIVLAGCAHTSPIDDTGRQRARAGEEAVQLCAGLPIDAIERTLADDPARVVLARPTTEFGGRPRRLRVTGAELVVRHELEVDDSRIERLYACHAARYGTGLAAEAASRDPLGVPGVQIRARRVGAHVVLSLRTPEDRENAELARRAVALVSAD